MKRITKEDVLAIRAGTLKSFGLEDNAACGAAKTCIQYVKRMCRKQMAKQGIKDYKARVNWEQSIITIQAIAL